MNTVEKYKSLCTKRDALQVKLATLDGERQGLLKRMHELGFSSVEEIVEFLEKKKQERMEKEAQLEEVVSKFEAQLLDAENKLKEIQNYAI